ncbi:hypothetical protein JD844_023222 [Phrynosoma platyrhinos]|uniref:Male-enhanced antigen 1 n=1 Tax=Phrynosoma platyrhinos TaxID=52577 RepID=A0ABQ7SWE2_PHRPL|nr:hypothetical protein JD844_023222 [Phrynosoma platyrhinos]
MSREAASLKSSLGAPSHLSPNTTWLEDQQVPPAISEDDSIIIHLVPMQQPLPVDPPPAEESEPQDLPSSPAASDETQINGEGPQEEAIQSPAGETQSTGGGWWKEPVGKERVIGTTATTMAL